MEIAYKNHCVFFNGLAQPPYVSMYLVACFTLGLSVLEVIGLHGFTFNMAGFYQRDFRRSMVVIFFFRFWHSLVAKNGREKTVWRIKHTDDG